MRRLRVTVAGSGDAFGSGDRLQACIHLQPTDVGIEACPAVHEAGAPALSLRIGIAHRVIGYSGDTEWKPTLIGVARGSTCSSARRTA